MITVRFEMDCDDLMQLMPRQFDALKKEWSDVNQRNDTIWFNAPIAWMQVFNSILLPYGVVHYDGSATYYNSGEYEVIGGDCEFGGEL